METTMTTTPMVRNRKLGPTQERVLEALRLVPDDEAVNRAGLQQATGLSMPQVRSALRGLERRGLAVFELDDEHTTAARWWSATAAE
jgi:DNA-binding GntR family transcriptional regulator